MNEDRSPIGSDRVAAQAEQLAFLRAHRPAAQDFGPETEMLAGLPEPRPLATAAAGRPARLEIALASLAFVSVIGTGLLYGPQHTPEPGATLHARQQQQQQATAPAARTVVAQADEAPRTELALDMPRPTRKPAAVQEARVLHAALVPPAAAADCGAVLTQLSLGEPLNAKQAQTLEASCR